MLRIVQQTDTCSHDSSLQPGLSFSNINEGSRKRKVPDNYDNAGHTFSARVQGLPSSPISVLGVVAVSAVEAGISRTLDLTARN